MVEPVIPLGWVEVALLIALMAAVVALSAWLRLALARDFAIGAARSVAQLTLVGFFIGWVFRQQTWYWVLGLLSLMALVAGFTGARRSGVRVPGLVLLFTVVVVLVTAVTLLYLTQLVIGVREWNPRYLIPLGGMLLGNTMTSATLAVERLVAELRGRASDVGDVLAVRCQPSRGRWPKAPPRGSGLVPGVAVLPMARCEAPFRGGMGSSVSSWNGHALLVGRHGR